ncbi:MAG: hypothetical protein DMD74_00900, partial [Gemmatimonadetes bacterium]
RALGLDEREQTTIRIGAYLHDLGKVRIPPHILSKPGPLTPDEFAVVQMHPTWGIELLAEIQFPWEIQPIIRWHHERYDGTGYPDQLRGDAIPVAAQIVGIVDVYDALTTTRPYHPALAPAEALAEIGRWRDWWSEAVYEAFLASVPLLQAQADDVMEPTQPSIESGPLVRLDPDQGQNDPAPRRAGRCSYPQVLLGPSASSKGESWNDSCSYRRA